MNHEEYEIDCGGSGVKTIRTLADRIVSAAADLCTLELKLTKEGRATELNLMLADAPRTNNLVADVEAIVKRVKGLL